MFKKLLVLSLPLLLVACSSDDEPKNEPVPQAPLTQSKNNITFNKAFEKLIRSYNSLYQGFVLEDTSAIAKAVKSLQLAADSLPVKELKSDSTIIETALNYAMTISDEAKGLMGEQLLGDKRKSFEMIANNLFDIVRTIQYDQAKFYKIHCPLAMDNKGADWVSTSSIIENPYIPKVNINCGEMIDSLDFRKK